MKKSFLMNKYFLNNGKIRRRVILLCTIIVLGLGWYGLSILKPWEINIVIPGVDRQLPDYIFEDIVLTSVSGAQTSFRIASDSLVLDRTNGFMNNVTGSIMNKDGLNTLDFVADDGVLNVPRQSAVFRGFVGHTFYPQRWEITAGEVHWDSRKQNFTLTKEPRVFDQETLITARRMIYDAALNTITIDQECEIHRDEHILKSSRAVLQDNLLTLDKNVSLSGADFTLLADTLEWDTISDILTFKNNINLRVENTVLIADKVSINAEQTMVYFQDNVRLQNDSENFLVNTDRAIWDRLQNQIEFFENTRAWRNNSLLESEHLIYAFDRNDLLAEGGGRTRLIRNFDE